MYLALMFQIKRSTRRDNHDEFVKERTEAISVLFWGYLNVRNVTGNPKKTRAKKVSTSRLIFKG